MYYMQEFHIPILHRPQGRLFYSRFTDTARAISLRNQAFSGTIRRGIVFGRNLRDDAAGRLMKFMGRGIQYIRSAGFLLGSIIIGVEIICVSASSVAAGTSTGANGDSRSGGRGRSRGCGRSWSGSGSGGFGNNRIASRS